MELWFGVLVVGVVGALGLVMASRFGLASLSRRSSSLERFAADRGYRLTNDGMGFVALKNGVALDVRMVVTPEHRGPSFHWIVEGRASGGIPGKLALWPKHEDQKVGLRTGDVLFDDCFRIEGTSRAVAVEVLGDAARRALLAFGDYGESSYDDGVFRFEWDGRDASPFGEIDRALAIATAVCTSPARGYRDA